MIERKYRVSPTAPLVSAYKWIPGLIFEYPIERRDDGVYVLVPRGWQKIATGEWVIAIGHGDDFVISANLFRKMWLEVLILKDST